MTDKIKTDLNEQWLSAQDRPASAIPECDVEKYREHIKDLDLSEAEQTELLKTIWTIMAAFVDLGFGIDSVQLLSSSPRKPESLSGQNDGKDYEAANVNGVSDDE
ncbi:MAG: hypothetical protein KME41_08355 [Candidatus Thiodiazotropha sp. (ex Lucina pensylvanica)]|nr:hypothetical protein [Candidatus Thiodiazotropha sp. (ex Lucina pensylvanica)]